MVSEAKKGLNNDSFETGEIHKKFLTDSIK